MSRKLVLIEISHNVVRPFMPARCAHGADGHLIFAFSTDGRCNLCWGRAVLSGKVTA